MAPKGKGKGGGGDEAKGGKGGKGGGGKADLGTCTYVKGMRLLNFLEQELLSLAGKTARPALVRFVVAGHPVAAVLSLWMNSFPHSPPPASAPRGECSAGDSCSALFLRMRDVVGLRACGKSSSAHSVREAREGDGGVQEAAGGMA